MHSYDQVRNHLGIAVERRKRTYTICRSSRNSSKSDNAFGIIIRDDTAPNLLSGKTLYRPSRGNQKVRRIKLRYQKCNGRREILAHVDKLKPVKDFDNSDPDQDRLRAMSGLDQEIEEEGLDLEPNDRHNRVREPTLTGPPPCDGDWTDAHNAPSINLWGTGVWFVSGTVFKDGNRLGLDPHTWNRLHDRASSLMYIVQLEGNKAQRRHVREAHRDVLERNRETTQERRRCT